MKLVGANASPTVTGEEELPGKSNYFIGNDPKKWRTNVPNYAQVRYAGIYPCVDLVYYGNQGGQLEYDFVVAPGGDPNAIVLDVGAGLVPAHEGHPRGVPLRISADGDLVVKTDGGDVRFHKPIVYQTDLPTTAPSAGSSLVTRHSSLVEGHYALQANNQVGFQVAPYDHSKALFIDPTLSYSTYLGGSVEDIPWAITADSSGSAYITGQTYSANFPVTNGALQTSCAPKSSTVCTEPTAFVTKLSADGSSLVYSTFLNGQTGGDIGESIAVDSSGDALIMGSEAGELDFPTTPGAIQATCNVASNLALEVFVAKLNPTGSSLVYSTCLQNPTPNPISGTLGVTSAGGIAVDAAGNAYVTGETDDPNEFPTTQGTFQPTCVAVPPGGYGAGACDVSEDPFVAKIDPTGALLYSTFLTQGNIGSSVGTKGIAVDSLGNAYVIGDDENSDQLITTPGSFMPSCPSQGCLGFVLKINGNATALVYSTYLGGSNYSHPTAVAVDQNGLAYVTGWTQSTDFPTTPGALQYYFTPPGAATSNLQDGFVVKVGALGDTYSYSTFLGGTAEDTEPAGIAVDAAGDAYVTGYTFAGFPTTPDAFQTSLPSGAAGEQAFFCKLDPAGASLLYSTFLAGTSGDILSTASFSLGLSSDIAVDASGNAYLTGPIASNSFPTTAGAFQTHDPIAQDGQYPTGFVAKFSFALDLSPATLTFGPQNVGTASAPQTVTVTNTGTASLTISSALVGGTNSGDFATNADTCTGATLTPTPSSTSTCTINVTFTPSATGSFSASLIFTDNVNGVAGSTQTVSLTGTGITAPVAGVSPSSLTFGNQDLGTTSASQPVTLSNMGNAALTITSIGISANFGESDNCNGSVAIGGSCTINVTFSPALTATAGTLTGTLTITDNSNGVENSTQTVTLSGTGIAVPLVSFSPTSLGFGIQLVNTTSAAQTLTVTNTGTAPLTISTVTLVGTNASNFAKSADTCSGATLAPTPSSGSTCTVSVTFTPPAKGSFSASLSFADNATPSSQTVSLTGSGGVPMAVVSQTTLTFGSLSEGMTSNPQGVVLSNTGNGTLNISSIAITGTNAGAFTITGGGAPPCSQGQALTAGNYCEIVITFSPTAVGTVTATLTITDNSGGTGPAGSTQTVTLYGTGSAMGVLLQTIAVTPLTPSIAVGSTPLQFMATGNYSDGTMQDLTDTATWTSSAPAVATISNASGSQGLATAVDAGTTTIKAAIEAPSGLIYSLATLTVTGGFLSTGSLSPARYNHTATLLSNGLVLIAGGEAGGAPLASAELYNPATGTFSPTTNLSNGMQSTLNTARYQHTATLLNDGTVLIVGGIGPYGLITGSILTNTTTAELYNPGNGTFSPTAGGLNTPRFQHTATLLNDGTVLIAGGYGSSGPLASAELYNPATGMFSPTINLSTGATTSLNRGRYDHTATLLDNGTVLMAGGYGNFAALASAELYDPSTGTFSYTTGGPSLGLNMARLYHTATLLNDGTVLIAGGEGSSLNSLASAELYNPATGTFSYTMSNGTPSSLTTARYYHTATLLNNGMVLIAGGIGLLSDGFDGPLVATELYDPTGGGFTPTGSLNTARELPTATLLNNGMVLVAAGYNFSGPLTSAELYEPATLTPPNLSSITLSPSSPTLPLDTAQHFTATGTFSDNSTQQLASVTWSSSNSAVVNITNDAPNLGAAYALAAGSATVSACAGAICDSTMVTAVAATSNTPTGTNVTLTPPPVSGATVSVTFADVTTPGTTTVTASSACTSPPESFSVGPAGGAGECVDISTTAGLVVGSTITITLSFNPANYPPSGPPPQIFHGVSETNGVIDWVNVTVPGSVNYTNDTIMASWTYPPGLSPFGIFVGLPAVSLSGTSQNFGSVLVDAPSSVEQVTLTNNGGANLVISTAAVSGTNAGDFATTADTCSGATVTPSSTCSVSVTFTPSAEGNFSASLIFTDNNNGVAGSTQTVSLSGTGIEIFVHWPGPIVLPPRQPSPVPGQPIRVVPPSPIVIAPISVPVPVPVPAPVIHLASSSLAFSAQGVGTSSHAQTVTLTNTSSVSETISSITASGDFSQTSTCPTTLSPGADCTISVTFKPAATGTRTGTLSISGDPAGSPRTVALSGTGLVSTGGPGAPVHQPSPPAAGAERTSSAPKQN
jgi:hypothetical protein